MLIIDVQPDQIKNARENSVDYQVIEFEIPVLVHATVLPPQKDQDYVDVGIPKNAKLYVNFIKSSIGNHLRGRYSTDCLFHYENFVGIGMIDDNVHRTLVEHRLVLNHKMYKVTTGLTIGFLVIGLLVFIKLLFMSGTSADHSHHHKDQSHHHEHHKPAEEQRPKATEGLEKEKTD